MLTLDRFVIQQDGFRLSADLVVPTGAKTAIIGPSGAGKSTLLNTLAGFVTPSSGQIFWDGTDLSPMEPGARPISIVFQDNNLFPHLSVFQNVAVGIRPNKRLSESETERVDLALDKVGLKSLAARKPAALSGGQRSRVALARVLVREKPLLLLDEPFSALGPAHKDEMLDLVAALVEQIGATLLMVTHDPKDAVRIADQTILVADGVANPPIDTAGLMADPPKALRDYLGG